MLSQQLKYNPFFNGIGQEHAAKLIGCSSIKDYDKDTIIYTHGDESRYVYIIISGWVKLFRETFDGQEAMLGLATAGDIIGESGFDSKQHLFSAQALNHTKLLKTSQHKLKEILETNGTLALKVISSLNNFINRYELHIEHASTMNAAQRIGCFIIKLCENQRVGTRIITLPFDKMLIASYLGMKRETFSRGLQKLRFLNIKVQGNKITIPEIQKLIEFSCVSCSLFNEDNKYISKLS
jgi:CRP-like cAMP-binding protein